MKIKKICMWVLLCLGILPTVQGQTFDKLWKQVEQAEKKSLPQTVIKLADEIYQKGVKEKNSPQMLKAAMWRMKYQDMLTPDSLYAGLKELEQWAEQTEKPMDRAILHSLIAGMYADYAAENQWQLSQRIEIAGEAPAADIREWTTNMFIDKVLSNTQESLKDSVLLLKTSSRTYIPFVELGVTSEYYHHDMYHLLASRGIEALQKIQYLSSNGFNNEGSISVKQNISTIYENMLSAYDVSGLKEGYVLTMLNYLNWKREVDRSVQPFQIQKGQTGWEFDTYETALEGLKDKFRTEPICAEVYLALANYAYGMRSQFAKALQFCDEAIRLYPKYNRINALKNLRETIVVPILIVNAPKMAFPGEEVKLRVSYKNLDRFTLSFCQGKTLVKEQHYEILRTKNYSTQDTVLTVKAPEIGAYTIRVIPDTLIKKDVKKDKKKDNDNECSINVTRFKVLSCRLPGDQYEVVTLDAQTGHPISDATVVLYDNDEKVLQEFTTGGNGKVAFPWKNEYRFLKATKAMDTVMLRQNIYGGSFGYYGNDNKGREEITLLTDRSLYRPGQTVYVKGIAYMQKSDTAHVIANKEYTVTLLDANNQEVGRKTMKTNEFGSFATDFALPSFCLNGTFTLMAGEGRSTIRVEEYKRPTFDITFDKQEGSYKLGDKVLVKGKAQSYSGVLLQDLPVKYTVQRSELNGWRLWNKTLVTSGEVMLDANGEFTIPVELKENEADQANNRDRMYYRYSIEATITNVAGETQTSTDVISVGTRSLILQMELKDKIRKDKPVETVFKVQNLNGQPVAVKGNYFLYLGNDKNTPLSDEKPIATGVFTSNEAMTIDWKNLPSGSYILKASVKDEQNREVTAEVKTVLFSVEDKRPPIATPTWFYESNTKFDATHPAVFYFGTSEKDAYVMMNVFSGDKLLESKTMNLSDTIIRFEYPYLERYGDGAFVNFCLVRNGQVYQQQVSLEKRLPDKTLTMKWDVFRDKLRPGQKEEWKLTIQTPQGKAADAEMLATMYDASLDKIWNRPQNFLLSYNRILPFFYWMSAYSGDNRIDYLWESTYLKCPSLEYDHFVTQSMVSTLMGIVGGVMRTGSAANYMIRGMSRSSGAMEMKYAPVSTSADAADTAEMSAETGEQLSEAPADLRTNLAETAFFYPQLRTNQNGEISFAFTMPESLTRWNFRGFSHTKGMLTGTLDGEATTSKEFMLTPNLPRFVRVGDETSIPASIANMTGKPQAGTVSMIFFDPATDKVISTQKQKFFVAAGRTIGVNFIFPVTDQFQVLGCRMIADSGIFSDGEQQLIPVLSNKEHLVETLPLPIRGEETRTFSLDPLFNHHSKTATDRRLTVEFTGNPAWYAIQALPSLSLPVNNNAISWATAYYANSLASFIMNSQPRVKAVFDSWKLQGGTKETLLSNLQKNQEVKNILLSESPWVLEAQTEEQQKERIATLFNLNNILSNNISAITRLQELQNSKGAWAWYKGMDGSRYVTTYIAELNARLAMLTGQPLTGDALAMQQKAFAYLHQSVLDDYNESLKSKKQGEKVAVTGVPESILQYLYLIAISGEQVPEANKAAYAYYLSKVGELLTSASMDTKAIAAIVLDKAGREKEAQEFIASLRQHLTNTDEQGMFFAFNENPYTWGGMNMQAHVDVMEALELTGGNRETVEEMKLWLLKQKQTQQWNSPVATADAVYALLMSGTNLLDNQGDVRIVLANQVLNTAASGKTVSSGTTAIPGLGYIKQSFTQKNVVDARTIVVEKKTPGIAWGAVYAQYEAPISDVKQQGGELNVQKQLYVERMVNNAPQLQPITKETILRIGDKVVSRLSIRTDRAMDFVQLKDQRGACFEPIESISGYRWGNGIGYYVDIKDASTNFFFDRLGKGVYVLEYSYRVSRAGTYETGLATMQCAYAPEYASHSASMVVKVAGE